MTAPMPAAHKAKAKRSSWFLLLELIFVVSLLSNMVIYGGIPSMPKLGPIMERSISKQEQLLTLYMRGGQWLLKIPGLRAASHLVLDRALSKGMDEIVAEAGSAAMLLTERSYSGTHSALHVLRWTTPVFFFAALIGQFFRPRQIRTLR